MFFFFFSEFFHRSSRVLVFFFFFFEFFTFRRAMFFFLNIFNMFFRFFPHSQGFLNVECCRWLDFVFSVKVMKDLFRMLYMIIGCSFFGSIP